MSKSAILSRTAGIHALIYMDLLMISMKAKNAAKSQTKKPKVIHLPRLDTVLMVEDTIRKLDYCPTKNQLWRALPKAVMWQTFSVIIDYLLKSNKIMIDRRDNRIVWIAVYNPKLKKLFDNAIPYEKLKKAHL